MGEIISSREMCRLIVNVLKLKDRKIITHCERTALLVYYMLKSEGILEEFEIADYVFLTVLHDIGAFKTEDTSKGLLSFEIEKPMAHSIYGYLFLKHLSPFGDRAKILLYNHIDWKVLKGIDFDMKKMSNVIGFAERVDLYNHIKGSRFNYNDLRSKQGIKYSKAVFDMMDIAARKYEVFDKLNEEQAHIEFPDLIEGLMYSDEEKQRLAEMLLYVICFTDERRLRRTLASVIIAQEIAKYLENIDKDQMSKLYFGAILHDVGMFSVPQAIADAAELTDEKQIKAFRRHVDVVDNILKNRIDPEVYAIAVNHHERIDGTGYPRGLKNENMGMLEKIMQAADRAAELYIGRGEIKGRPMQTVVSIMMDEMNHNKFHRRIVVEFAENASDIAEKIQSTVDSMIEAYKRINLQYEQIKGVLKDPARPD